MTYQEVIFHTNNVALNEILIAELNEIGFDAFEETNSELKAYVSKKEIENVDLESLSKKYQVDYSINEMEEQNWNELWESNFSPICVDKFVGIRAAFHPPITTVEYEIVITPKMSFGTGHHATTYMMMQLMNKIDFKSKAVLDFGTGTGILAILAEKLGSQEIVAIDYDEWCIENSIENTANNNCKNITMLKGDTAKSEKKFDIILANINKNIILSNLIHLTQSLKYKGTLLLSGLLDEDEKDIINATKLSGLKHVETTRKDNWIAIYLSVDL